MITEEKIAEFINTFSLFNRAKTFMQMQVYMKGENIFLNKLAELGGESSPSTLAKELEMTGPRVTAILCSLEIKKLVARKSSAEDKRKTIVAITPKGQKWVDNSTAELMATINSVVDRLGEDDTQELLRIMKKLLGVTDSNIVADDINETQEETSTENLNDENNGGESLE